MTDSALAAHFFLQLGFILLVCRGVGMIARRLGQPPVVAEMLAGFLIGPSFFAWIAPGVQGAIFPADSLKPLYVCSQIGLALYMFTVGLEFQTTLLTKHAKHALSVSITGVAAPMILGGALAVVMHRGGGFFTESVTVTQAVLFVGAAMSITAFPVLARIIHERGIAGTALGTLALAAGAINDAAAWVIMAIVLGSFSGSVSEAIWPAVGAVIYVLAIRYAVRPLLERFANEAEQDQQVQPWMLSVVLALLALGAWFTDMVGIYAVFGAFVFGVAIPRGILSRELQRSVGPLATAVLVPLYFVYSGLNTQLGLLNTAWLWAVAALVFLAACAGKGVACWAAARVAGASNRDALGIATLMNARGLMELILLNIALQRQLITPTTFTIMALMTIGTTLMAYPLFGLFCPAAPRTEPVQTPGAVLEH